MCLSDRLKQRGGDHTSDRAKASPDAFANGKSADELAEKLGISGRTVERTRAVLASDEENIKEQLLAGEIAPKAAYEQVRRTEAMKADSVPLSTTPTLFTPAPKVAHAAFSTADWTALNSVARVVNRLLELGCVHRPMPLPRPAGPSTPCLAGPPGQPDAAACDTPGWGTSRVFATR